MAKSGKTMIDIKIGIMPPDFTSVIKSLTDNSFNNGIFRWRQAFGYPFIRFMEDELVTRLRQLIKSKFLSFYFNDFYFNCVFAR